jgi:hypothetical protein
MYRNRVITFLIVGFTIFFSIPVAIITLQTTITPPVDAPKELRDLWSLDRAEGFLARYMFDCCNKSLRPDQVEIGKNGYMFLGNDYANIMDYTTGEIPEIADQIPAKVASLKRLQKGVEERGAKFAFVLAPNKHSIYPEELPVGRKATEKTPTDLFVLEAVENGINALDLRPNMIALKERGEVQVYLLADSHWSNAGGAFAYTKTMDFLRNTLVSNLEALDVQVSPKQGTAGDLVRLLKLQEFLPREYEKTYDVEFPQSSICFGKNNLQFELLEKCTQSDNKRIFAKRTSVTFTRASAAPNPQTVLMLCDSFCTSASNLFSASFQDVHRTHWSSLRGEILKNYLDRLKPDLVILQMVERNILNSSVGFD